MNDIPDAAPNHMPDDFEAFAARTTQLLDEHGALLLGLAKHSIEHALETGRPADVDLNALPAALRETGACFVTLKIDERLRGCIGSPEAHRPLGQDVTENAYRAAFHDPRFAPLSVEEADGLNVHISVLSAAKPMTFSGEADLLAQLEPGRDGLIIGDLGRRALFLPSVWAQLPDKRQFLSHLRAKAGLAADHWSDTFEASRFVAPETGADWPNIDSHTVNP